MSGPGPEDAPGPDDALAANYARGGFGQSLAWGSRPALVLVDLIRAYEELGVRSLQIGVEELDDLKRFADEVLPRLD